MSIRGCAVVAEMHRVLKYTQPKKGRGEEHQCIRRNREENKTNKPITGAYAYIVKGQDRQGRAIKSFLRLK